MNGEWVENQSIFIMIDLMIVISRCCQGEIIDESIGEC